MAKPSKRPVPDPVAWARATKRRTGGQACALCGCADAMRAVRAWIPLWKSGAITVSIAQAADYLNAHTPWKGAVGTFRRCLKEHHGFSTCG